MVYRFIRPFYLNLTKLIVNPSLLNITIDGGELPAAHLIFHAIAITNEFVV